MGLPNPCGFKAPGLSPIHMFPFKGQFPPEELKGKFQSDIATTLNVISWHAFKPYADRYVVCVRPLLAVSAVDTSRVILA